LLTPEQKREIIGRIKEKGERVADLAKEYGVQPRIIYGYLSRSAQSSGTLLELSKLKREKEAEIKTILDVGGGPGSILEFLSPKRYNFYILDKNAKVLNKIKNQRVEKVLGDGCDLPFPDNFFDTAISIDTLEHIPENEKGIFCSELKRVAKKYVIIHCPADSFDGKFQGTNYDERFLEWYRKRFRKDEENTLEHLNSGLPKIEELVSLFPGASIIGKQNGEVWLKYMKQEMTPYIRFIAGLFYKLFLSKKDDLPPYHACLIMWGK